MIEKSLLGLAQGSRFSSDVGFAGSGLFGSVGLGLVPVQLRLCYVRVQFGSVKLSFGRSRCGFGL